jgi:TonB family protein
MNGSTTDVIVARSHDVDRLSTMVMWSVAAHVVVTAVVVLMPHSKADLTPKEVMTITIGGAPGPRTGMTQMGARAVQAPEPPIKQAETAPSPVKPEMTLPDPKLKPRPQPKNAPKEAAAKTLSTGAEPQEGTAKAETRVRGQGFGLSSGGGGSTGGVTLDVTDFCCPDYILTMKELVTQNWVGKRNRTGLTKMMFTILKDGRLEGIRLETSSGSDDLDNEAARALRVTRLPPLPSRYPNPTLTVHLEFAYER